MASSGGKSVIYLLELLSTLLLMSRDYPAHSCHKQITNKFEEPRNNKKQRAHQLKTQNPKTYHLQSHF